MQPDFVYRPNKPNQLVSFKIKPEVLEEKSEKVEKPLSVNSSEYLAAVQVWRRLYSDPQDMLLVVEFDRPIPFSFTCSSLTKPFPLCPEFSNCTPVLNQNLGFDFFNSFTGQDHWTISISSNLNQPSQLFGYQLIRKSGSHSFITSRGFIPSNPTQLYVIDIYQILKDANWLGCHTGIIFSQVICVTGASIKCNPQKLQITDNVSKPKEIEKPA